MKLLSLRNRAMNLLNEAKVLNIQVGRGFSRFKNVGSTGSIRASDLSQINFQNYFQMANLIRDGKLHKFTDFKDLHSKAPRLSRKFSQLEEMLIGKLMTHDYDPCDFSECAARNDCQLNKEVRNVVAFRKKSEIGFLPKFLHLSKK